MIPEERIEQLEQRLQQLEQRLANLEDTSSDTDFSVLQRLQKRRGAYFEHGDIRGAVTYAGYLSQGESQLVWQAERGFPKLLNSDSDQITRVLAALGHKTRLEIVRTLLEAPASNQDFQEQLGVSSTGQLYHHLKELRAAGIIAQANRGEYHLVPQTILPVLAIFAAALDIVIEPQTSLDQTAKPSSNAHAQ